jgi:hypothetical protein
MGIKSIWDNDYYKNYKPMPKWAFSVNFTTFSDKISMGELKLLNKSITNAVWGKKELASMVPVYYAGVMANHPGRMTTAGELSLTFNDDGNLRITNLLENIYRFFTFDEDYIINANVNDKGEAYKPFNKPTDNVIEVIIYKPSTSMAIDDDFAGEIVGKYEFHNCFPTNLEEVEMNYDSDEIVQRTMRFSYDYMIRTE